MFECLFEKASCIVTPLINHGKLCTRDTNAPFQNENQTRGWEEGAIELYQEHRKGLHPSRIFYMIYKLLRSTNSFCFNVMVGRGRMILERLALCSSAQLKCSGPHKIRQSERNSCTPRLTHLSRTMGGTHLAAVRSHFSRGL